MKVVDLKVKLKELGLSQYGNKAELVKRLKDHFYAPPTDADDSDSSDDESSGLVVQKNQKNLDDTDQLSEYDNAEDNENAYDNENGEDNESGESEAPSNKRSRGKIYAPFASFKSLDSAFLALQSEWLNGIWKRGNCAPRVRATTIWYKCKQCTLSLKLMVTKDESKRCTLWAEDKFDSSGNLLHEHDDTATQAKDRGIPQHVKAKLIFFDSLHIKPKAMIEQLRSDGFVPPTMTQVNNFLKHHRKKNLGETKFCLQDLVDWAERRGERPIDDDTAYVFRYAYESLPAREFKIFITTYRLIGHAQYVSTVLCVFSSSLSLLTTNLLINYMFAFLLSSLFSSRFSNRTCTY